MNLYFTVMWTILWIDEPIFSVSRKENREK